MQFEIMLQTTKKRQRQCNVRAERSLIQGGLSRFESVFSLASGMPDASPSPWQMQFMSKCRAPPNNYCGPGAIY